MNANDKDDRWLLPEADVSTLRVARVYAEALLKSAELRNQTDDALQELEELAGLLRAQPDLAAYFANLAIGRDQREQALKNAFGDGRASDLLLNFLLVLNRHDRLELVRPVLTAYKQLYDRRKRQARVSVTSAVPLDHDQVERLKSILRDIADREPIIDARVDPDLLGGLVVRVGDWLYDASVRTQIETLRTQLIERSSHEIKGGRDRFSSGG